MSALLRPLLAVSLAVSLAVAFIGVASVSAAGNDAARRAEDISSRTMSPFCPGRTLSSCPSPSAAEWRHDIRRWTDEGLSTAEIRARLEARVPGRDLSGAPSSPGGRLLPVALAVLSAGVLIVILRRLRPSSRRAEKEPATLPEGSGSRSATLDQRLDEELEDLDD